jgi:hypothetical protein
MIKWALRSAMNKAELDLPVMFDHGQVSAPAALAGLTA